MKTGIKLFENFDKLYLEVCVPYEHKKRFENDYALRTNYKLNNEVDGYNTRQRRKKYNAWGIEFRVYFKTSIEWIVESLQKLGFHTEISEKLIAVEFNNQHPEHGYQNRVSNQELFWWLVDYGYRLGENNSIPYEFYQMRKTLETLSKQRKQIVPTLNIIEIESENPIEEAQLLAV